MRLGFGFAVDPGGWRARGDFLDFEVFQSRQQLGQIASRGHTQSFARLDDGQDCGHLRSRIPAVDMDPALAAEGDAPHRVLREVVG